MSAVVLGIDGGGTRTRASIVNGEKVLAFAENGSIKRLRVGAQVAEEHLRLLLAEVYAQAGVNSVRAASAGVASSTMPGVQEWIAAVFGDFHVENRKLSATRSSPWTRHFAAARESCRSPAPAPTASAALPTAAAKRRAAGVRAWAMRAPATGSACTPCGAL